MAELDKLSKQARGTWEGFLSLTKWAILLIALVLVAMALFLA
jgi:flagellar biosynthesis/type III secretory pathway M-ring protein FliF/YscJ